MSKKNELKWGAFLSYIQMALSAIIGIVYTPIMVRLLGQNEYGLYSTVSSTISMLSILSLGFNSSYIHYYAVFKRNNDLEKIYYLNGLFLVVFFIIGMIAFICGSYLTTHLEIIFDKGLTVEEYATAETLMILLTISLSVSFPISVFSTIINANERFIFLKLLMMGKTIICPIVNLPLLLAGFGSVGLVISSLVFSLIIDAFYLYYVFFVLNNKFVFKGKDSELFRHLFVFSSFIAINIIVDQINTNIDRVLLGRFKGTASVAVYSVGSCIYGYYMSLSTAISSVFTPKVNALYNEFKSVNERNEYLSELFIKVGRIQFILLMLVASGFVFFGKPFFYFWLGEGYGDSYYVALLLLLPASVPLIQNIGIEIQRAANKHHFRSVAYIIMAVINLLMSIKLCQLYGAIGSAVGTAFSLILANGIIMNIYYYKALHIEIPRFWKSIIKMAMGMIPAFVIGMIFSFVFKYSSIISLIMVIMLYTLVYAVSNWFFVFNKFEKEIFVSIFNKYIINRGR